MTGISHAHYRFGDFHEMSRVNEVNLPTPALLKTLWEQPGWLFKRVRESGKEREYILQPQSYNKISIKKKKKKVIKAVILLHLVI